MDAPLKPEQVLFQTDSENRDVVKDCTENLSSTGVSGGESLLRGDAKE